MGRKGVEEMINEMEAFIDSCKYQTLSSTKIVVPKDELDTMLGELKLKMPSEIERCKKIMRNKEAILSDARTKADGIITEAANEANRLVGESQIVELANMRANEIIEMARVEAGKILDDATNEANEVRLGSMLYTKDMLTNIDNFIAGTLDAERANFTMLIDSLQNNQDVIATNINEINGQISDFTGETEKEDAKREARQAEAIRQAEEQVNATVEAPIYDMGDEEEEEEDNVNRSEFMSDDINNDETVDDFYDED